MPPEKEIQFKRLASISGFGLAFVLMVWGISAPSRFPAGEIISVPQGASLYLVSETLKNEQVIRSPFWFRLIAIMLGGERRLQAGQYYLGKPEAVTVIAWRILHGRHEIKTGKITVPEGFTVEKISGLFGGEFSLFVHRDFERWAPEGYLFPDTYFVPLSATASSTIKMMRDNFERKILELAPEIEKSKKKLADIIVMASLIEGETNTQRDREWVSEILWKRLRIGMPLQVDVERATYEFRGLPEKPINNPGLASIRAAINPATSTPYLYYLTGDDGKMYYAKTFEEHKVNIAKHLSN